MKLPLFEEGKRPEAALGLLRGGLPVLVLSGSSGQVVFKAS